MTKQSRKSILSTLSTAIDAAIRQSNWVDKDRQYMRGIITKREYANSWTDAMTVSARLGKEEKPLHCPPPKPYYTFTIRRRS